MIEQLEAIKARFEQVGVALTNPEIISKQSEFQKLSKEYSQLEKIIKPFEAYKKVSADYDFAELHLEEEKYISHLRIYYCDFLLRLPFHRPPRQIAHGKV